MHVLFRTLRRAVVIHNKLCQDIYMICKNKLSVLKKGLIKDWKQNLKHRGVKLPKDGHRLNGILCLYENLGHPISQDEMIKWFQERGLEDYDRQIRHIADDGWYIVGGNTRVTRYIIDTNLKRNQICLKSIKEPNPKWVSDSTKRKNFLDAGSWEEILETFKDRGCAVCGRHYEKYDKGHLLNGAFDSYSKHNIVPMCSSCNNWGQRHDLEFKLYNNLIVRPIIKK